MNLAEKILAIHAGRDTVKPGDMVMAKLDMILGTDVTVPLSVEVFRNMGAEKVFDPNKMALVNDHFVPAKDVKAATLSLTMREFARDMKVPAYFEVGRSGICHSILPDNGLVRPGDLVVGADSHTCTYGALGAFSTGIGSTDMACAWAIGELWFRVPESTKVIVEGEFTPMVGPKDLILYIINKLGVEGARYQAIEFCGCAIEDMSMDGRITVCNMAIEAGAKTGLITPDRITRDFIENIYANPTPYTPKRGRDIGGEYGLYLESDCDAQYSQVLEVDLKDVEPQVSIPYLPSNTKPVGEVSDVAIHQVVIGSCTNGRIEDFRAAAKILGDKPVHPDVRLIMIPATPQITEALIEEGLATQFLRAGAIISPPTCGPCIGGHMGILAKGEVGLFTTNRNFRGRNGHPESQVYLAGPEVAAATALTGRISDPREL
ncbi:MAG: 3-isopropylmalate dehydratase large subunit [Calditrichaeota bacterium]|jgi:3-isopropylmalate/(R)-2-methylmalate dehydratase large subunit|nr:3-isopropylmalate dehydratase large subunit [Calditrichota bacterium]